MLDILMNPGDMTSAHWMIIGILFILVIGILYFVYRTYLVIKESSKNKYTPNIGLPQTGKNAASGTSDPGDNGEDSPGKSEP